jgi:hypothetical protein
MGQALYWDQQGEQDKVLHLVPSDPEKPSWRGPLSFQ